MAGGKPKNALGVGVGVLTRRALKENINTGVVANKKVGATRTQSASTRSVLGNISNAPVVQSKQDFEVFAKDVKVIYKHLIFQI